MLKGPSQGAGEKFHEILGDKYIFQHQFQWRQRCTLGVGRFYFVEGLEALVLTLRQSEGCLQSGKTFFYLPLKAPAAPASSVAVLVGQLEKLLKDAATKGDRQSSAAALVMRGDIIASASNDAPEELKRALRDGYMRVVLMYMDESCSRERGEAMLKAAQCFDKLGQSARAESLRAQAKK